jgi:hypothetical protein
MTLFAYAGEMAREEEQRRQLDQTNLRGLTRYFASELENISEAAGPIERIITRVKRAAKDLESVASSVSSTVKTAEKGEPTNPWTNQRLISELAPRLGSVMILLFLVPILVTMYRYGTGWNVRCSPQARTNQTRG